MNDDVAAALNQSIRTLAVEVKRYRLEMQRATAMKAAYYAIEYPGTPLAEFAGEPEDD